MSSSLLVVNRNPRRAAACSARWMLLLGCGLRAYFKLLRNNASLVLAAKMAMYIARQLVHTRQRAERRSSAPSVPHAPAPWQGVPEVGVPAPAGLKHFYCTLRGRAILLHQRVSASDCSKAGFESTGRWALQVSSGSGSSMMASQPVSRECIIHPPREAWQGENRSLKHRQLGEMCAPSLVRGLCITTRVHRLASRASTAKTDHKHTSHLLRNFNFPQDLTSPEISGLSGCQCASGSSRPFRISCCPSSPSFCAVSSQFASWTRSALPTARNPLIQAVHGRQSAGCHLTSPKECPGTGGW